MMNQNRNNALVGSWPFLQMIIYSLTVELPQGVSPQRHMKCSGATVHVGLKRVKFTQPGN